MYSYNKVRLKVIKIGMIDQEVQDWKNQINYNYCN